MRPAPAERVDALLQRHWPEARCELQAATPWELLVAVICSTRAADERVNQIMAVLHEHVLGPATLADADPRDWYPLLRRLPFYKQKARAICEAARAIHYRHGGRVPRDPAALRALAGVGRKTAAVVLGNAFGMPAVAADRHVIRVVHRWGWIPGEQALLAERAVERRLPEDRWVQACHQMIRLGREHCRPVKPYCSRCPCASICPRQGVVESR